MGGASCFDELLKEKAAIMTHRNMRTAVEMRMLCSLAGSLACATLGLGGAAVAIESERDSIEVSRLGAGGASRFGGAFGYGAGEAFGSES